MLLITQCACDCAGPACVRACAACQATFLTTLSVWGYDQDEEVSVDRGEERRRGRG